jgi:hypothetical protein
MALNAQGYFNCLTSYLNEKDYFEKSTDESCIVLREKIHQQQGEKPKEFKVTLKTEGDVIVVRLDAKDGKPHRLFHFLDDTAKPWCRRCDFVIFNLVKSKLFCYCIEFKSATIPPDVPDQLAASVSWVKSLHATIEAYTGKKLQISVLKFVFSEHDPVNSPYVDRDGKYLVKDHTIRHYTYAEANGAALKDLENTNIEVVR